MKHNDFNRAAIRKISLSLGDVWAIRAEELGAIFSSLTTGILADNFTVSAQHETNKGLIVGNTAVIPIMGVIRKRADAFSLFFGGASLDALTLQLNTAVADPAIARIVLDIDSPGGEVAGVQEFADRVFQARAVKPVVAVVNSLAASAAYWIASQSSEIVATPGSMTGSIGTVAIHQEASKALDLAGIATTLIFAGKKKVDGNPFEPLTEEARASIQALVDEQYDLFVKAVARGRGISAAAVRNGFGEGGVVGEKEVVSLGMADRGATMDVVLGGGKRISKKTIMADLTTGTPIEADAIDGVPSVLDIGVPNDATGFDCEARTRRWRNVGLTA